MKTKIIILIVFVSILVSSSNSFGLVLYENNFDDKIDWSSHGPTAGLATTHNEASAIGFSGYRVGGDHYGEELFIVSDIGCQNDKCLKVNYESWTSGSMWTGGGLDLHFSDLDIDWTNVPEAEGYEELYIRWMVKYQENWDWGSGSAYQKLFRAYSNVSYEDHWNNGWALSSTVDPASGKSGYIIDDFGGGLMNYYPSYKHEDGTPTQSDQDYGCSWNNNFDDGQWHTIEIQIKMNDIGQKNAGNNIYVDGILCGGYTPEDKVIRTTDIKFNTIIFADNYYNVVNNYTEQTYYVDDLVISTEYIGPTECPNGTDISEIGACWCGGSGAVENDSSNIYVNGTCVDGVWSEDVELTWQETLEAEFDIVETFDQLQDWHGIDYGNVDSGNLPILINGSQSKWTYYSDWNSEVANGEWISDFGVGTKIGGSGKSAIIDLGGTGKGPSRLGLYFGNGSANSGYEDVSFFWRVKLPKKTWPTIIQPISKIGSYDESEEYQWVGSWKFASFSHGFLDSSHWANSSFISANCNEYYCAYGKCPFVPHIYPYSGDNIDNKPTLRFETKCYDTEILYENIMANNNGDTSISLDQWIGIEFHFKLNTLSNTSANGIIDIWIYDEVGNSILLFHADNYELRDALNMAHKYNKFFFGGNNSGYWIWDASMQSWYYVDDFIIDDGSNGRIGSRYFTLLNGNHEADLDSDGDISNSEINTYVNEWKHNTVTISSLIEAMRLWKG